MFWQGFAGIVGQDSNLAAEKTKAAWREDIAHLGPETWRFAWERLQIKSRMIFNESSGFSCFLLWLWLLGLSRLVLAFVSFQLLALVAPLVASFYRHYAGLPCFHAVLSWMNMFLISKITSDAIWRYSLKGGATKNTKSKNGNRYDTMWWWMMRWIRTKWW